MFGELTELRLNILMFQDFADMQSIRLFGESEIRDEAKQACRCVEASWSVESSSMHSRLGLAGRSKHSWKALQWELSQVFVG